MSKPRTPTCRYHCSACGRHFASEAAFDLHRVGEYGLPRGAARGRRCEAPADCLTDNGSARLGSEDGVCRAYEAQGGIAVWFVTAARDRVARAFARGSA